MSDGAPSARRRWLGPIGWRLLAAFVAVSMVTLATLVGLATWGVGAGLDDLAEEEHARTADAAARLVAVEYAASGGWPGIDLEPARTTVHAASGRLSVFDSEGTRIAGPRAGQLTGSGPTALTELPTVTAAVVLDGTAVGTVVVTYLDHIPLLVTSKSLVRDWLVIAAVAGLLVAVAMGLWATRRLLRPIQGITDVASAYATGDRSARADPVGLTGELADLARSLNSAADAVAAQEAAGHRMVADLSHEIRGPLATLQAGLEELRDGLLSPTPERLGALHDQSLRLGRVVEDLTSLASAQEPPSPLVAEPCDLAEIAGAAIEAKSSLLRVSGQVVCLDLQAAPVTADPARLHQVVGNLLDNAIRYCPTGTHVRVGTAVRAGRSLLVLEDDGPGIPEADLAHVQERLYRGANAADVAGSGIGLAVAAEIIKAHQGTMLIDRPAEGPGTRVTVNLPARVNGAQEPQGADQREHMLGG